MQIRDLFTDNLVASTRLSPTLVPGLDTSESKGPITAADGIGPAQIAENFYLTTESDSANSAYARPSMLAHVSSFASGVRTIAEKWNAGKLTGAHMDSSAYRDFIEWQGLVAIVALHDIYSYKGLDISVKSIQLNSKDKLHECILLSMSKDMDYKTTITVDESGIPQGKLFYVCQKDEPFAIFHPVIGICPLQTYSKTLFDGVVDWFSSQQGTVKTCHEAWLPVCSGEGRLDDFFLARIAWWAEKNRMKDLHELMQKGMRDPQKYNPDLYKRLEASTQWPAVSNIDEIWQDRGAEFSTAVQAWQNAGSLSSLFTDTLFLAYVQEKSDSRLTYNTPDGAKQLDFSNAGTLPELAHFVPVLPFTQSGAKLLEKGCMLKEVRITAVAVPGGLSGVRVEVSIQTPEDEVLPLNRFYSAEALIQGPLPYMMVWPWVSLPAKMWKKYYATWQKGSGDVYDVLQDGSGSDLPRMAEVSLEMDGGEHHRIRRAASKDAWDVYYRTDPFRYAVMKNSEGAELGTIFVPQCAPLQGEPLSGTAIPLSVDFGTTSTVCGLKLSDGKNVVLPYRDYSRTITVEDPDTRRNVSHHHWLGTDPGVEHARKIFSVAQLFERADGSAAPNLAVMNGIGNQTYYVDGRLFLVSGALLNVYAGAHPGVLDPFSTQKIMNDMKFTNKLDLKNAAAAAIFLAGVYQYALLYLLSANYRPSAGSEFIKLRVSYPNDVTLNALKNTWSNVKEILAGTVDPVLLQPLENIHYYTEARATTQYQLRPGGGYDTLSNLISLDIGGGTTDISITNRTYPGEVRSLSVRYAGKEIMIDSIIETFRQYSPHATFERVKTFRDLWQASEKESSLMITDFDEICKEFQKSSSDDAGRYDLVDSNSLRMIVEMLLAGGMDLGDPHQPNGTNFLRRLIMAKFLMLMRLVAETIRNNLDMWCIAGHKGPLQLNGNTLSLHLSVTGTGAQLLQYVFNCSLGDLDSRDANALRYALPHSSACIDILNELFKNVIGPENLGENVSVNITFHVNHDVAEKLEVCYGMLQPGIETAAAPAAATAKAAAPASPAAPAMGAFSIATMIQQETAKQQQPALTTTEQEQVERQKHSDEVKQMFNQYRFSPKMDEVVEYIKALSVYINVWDRVIFGDSSELVGTHYGLEKPDMTLICKVYDLLSDHVEELIPASCLRASERRAAYMAEAEQEQYRSLLIKTYVTDDLFNQKMARYQADRSIH